MHGFLPEGMASFAERCPNEWEMPMVSMKFSGFAAAAVVALSVGATPALAFDEGRGSTFDTLLGMVGLADKPEEPNIQYRERAPLVLPPKTELRQPRQAASTRAANWPQDQETVAAARKRAQDGRVRLERIDEGVQSAAARELAAGRVQPSRQTGQGECTMDTDPSRPNNCDPATFWKSLSVKKQDETAQLLPGQEPERKYLTQPPKGYQKSTQRTKATFDVPQKPGDEDTARSFYLPRGKEE